MSDLKPLTDMGHLETLAVLKQLAASERELGRLEGAVKSIPNEAILTGTLFIQEARASSEIENIVTTQDEAFTSIIHPINANAKEVQYYNNALNRGYQIVRDEKLLTNRHILELQAIIKKNKAGFRTQMGTVLKDNKGQTVYTPPMPQDVENLMSNLERFINDASMSELNPLVKMAVIHHQFESIHPFYDGNGRVGRIINVLYLCLQGCLTYPVLYLSRHLIDNKADYYHLLQTVRSKEDKEDWEKWILFMLKAVEETAKQTVDLIENMLSLMQRYKQHIREQYPKMYSQDLINLLFVHPYTKVDFLSTELTVHRNTASKYLDTLCNDAFLKIKGVKLGRTNYYLNTQLIALFEEIRNEE